MIANLVVILLSYVLWKQIEPYYSLLWSKPISDLDIDRYQDEWNYRTNLDLYNLDNIDNRPFIPYRRFNSDTLDSTMIFRTGPWEEDDIPLPFLEIMKNTKQQWNHTQVYLSDRDALVYIKTNVPQFLDSYQLILPGAYKSDLLRMLLLYQFGGIYMDLGIQPLCAFHEINWNTLVMVHDGVDERSRQPKYGWYQGIMASPARNPFLMTLAQHMDQSIRRKYYGKHPLDITGPVFIQRMVRLYHISILPQLFMNEEKQVLIKGVNPVAFQTKCDGYYDLLYGQRNAIRYHRLWEIGLVYPYRKLKS